MVSTVTVTTISYYSIVLLVLVMLFSVSIVQNMFCVYFVNYAAYKAVLSTIEAILQEGSNNDKRSNLVDNNSIKETLLVLGIF
jgi:hypothetical protein